MLKNAPADSFWKGLRWPGCDGASTPVHPEPSSSSNVVAKKKSFRGDTIAVKRVRKTGHLGEAVSVPADWSFAQKGNSVLLRVPSARFRRVYGMVVAANHESSMGAVSPLMFADVLKLPFYFSGSALDAEVTDEWDLDPTVIKPPPFSFRPCTFRTSLF